MNGKKMITFAKVIVVISIIGLAVSSYLFLDNYLKNKNIMKDYSSIQQIAIKDFDGYREIEVLNWSFFVGKLT